MSDNEENKDFLGEEANTEDTSVPLLLSDKVKCDLSRFTFWCLRLTPENVTDYTFTDVQDFIEDLTIKDIYILCEEKSKKSVKHFHATFLSPNGLDPREEIKAWLVRQYPGKWKKEDGNKHYNLQQAKNNNKENKAFIYVTKDGDYIAGKGVNPKYVEYVNSQSFQKKDTRVGQLMESRKLYLEGKMTDRELFESLCDVCIATSQTGSLNMTYVKSFMTGAKAQKEPLYRNQLFSQWS